MALLRVSEVRKMDKKEMEKRLIELRLDLAKKKGNVSMGASAQSPGQIRETKKAIARLKTIQTQKLNESKK